MTVESKDSRPQCRDLPPAIPPAMSYLDVLQLIVAIAFVATWTFVGGVMIRHS